MELRQKEKENEFRMLNLKIKELKRTIQSTYVHKATDNKKNRKKSAKSVTKNTRPAQKTREREYRPNSSKRGGLAEAIKQEMQVDKKDFETPMEGNISHGVDFGGGNDSYEDEFDNQIDTSIIKDDKRGYGNFNLIDIL